MIDRLPSCIEEVEKLRAFSPNIAMKARGRPEFGKLPLNIIQDPSLDLEAMENQWMKLISFHLSEICPDENDIEVQGAPVKLTYLKKLPSGELDG